MSVDRESPTVARRRWNLIVVVALVMSACGGTAVDDSTTTSAASDTTTTIGSDDPTTTTLASTGDCRSASITMATAGDALTLDPKTIQQAVSAIIQPAYEPLIRRSPSGEYVPGLATSWEYVGDENTRFELQLREGVTFSDGGTLDAEGVKAHFEYMADGANSALIAGATFEVVDTYRVAINLATPNPLLEEILSQDWVLGFVISPTALASPESLGTTPAGAGQYILDAESTVAGDTYVYTANPDYWDQSQIHFEELRIRIIPNPDSVLNALRTGEVDFAVGDITTSQAAADAGLQVVGFPSVFQGLGMFDRSGTNAEALGDVRVRQAINYALDREALVTALYGPYGVPSSQIVPPGHEAYNDDTADFYTYDPDRARALLAEAGYGGGLRLDALSTGFANIGLAGQAVAGQLQEVGIELVLDEREVNGYIEALFGAQAPLAVVGLGSPPLHMAGGILLLPGALFNPFQTSDDDIVEWYNAAASASGDERLELERRIVAKVQEQGWFAPIGFTPVFYFGQADLGGLEVSGANKFVALTEVYRTDCS